MTSQGSKSPKTLGRALSLTYDACLKTASGNGAVITSDLATAMKSYVKDHYATVIANAQDKMLDHEIDATISSRAHGSRPSAASIRAMQAVATGIQPLLPSMEEAAKEFYRMPDGRLVPLGSMSIDDVRSVVELRTKQLSEDGATLGRLEKILAEMQRRNVKTVRELLAI